MRWVCCAVLMMVLAVSGARAEDEDDLRAGVLIAHYAADIAYTSPPPTEGWCSFYTTEGHAISDSASQNNMIDTEAEEWSIWFVIAAWHEGPKRVCSTVFGFGDYSADIYGFSDYGACAPEGGSVIEIASLEWPGPNNGVTVTTATGFWWVGNYMPVYYFAGYAYDPGGVIPLAIHPDQQFAGFANCVPPLPTNYEADCLGAMGIMTAGEACGPTAPPPPVPKVCCVGPSCYLVETEPECNLIHGEWHEGGLSCDPNPCVSVCCVVEACVLTYSQLACSALGGAWHGDWDNCGPPNPCEDQAASACCIYGECHFMSSEDCFEMLAACGNDCGEYFPGFRCEEEGFVFDCSDIENLPHACCVDDECYLLSEDECDQIQGTWRSTWNSCWGDPNPCVQPWACCLYGQCYSMLGDECDEIEGTWHPGYECADNDCGSLGACCFQNLCVLTFADECEAMSGSFVPGYDSCDPNPCPVYPCCQDDGTCQILSEADCQSAGGTWYQGADPTCSPNPCPQPAVCCVDTYCEVIQAAACEAAGGRFHDGFSSCDSVSCSDPLGVCCVESTCHEYQWESECELLGGEWLDDVQSCEGNPCGPPAEGACCVLDDCYVATQDSCETDLSGVWLSQYPDCDPNPCIVTDAVCCLENGECHILESDACAILGGTWHRDYQSCDDYDCPAPEASAACCWEGSCYLLLESQCDYIRGTFHEGYPDCEGVDCSDPLEVCCVDEACYLVWEADCALLGGEFEAGQTICDPNPCISPPIKMTWGKIKSIYR